MYDFVPKLKGIGWLLNEPLYFVWILVSLGFLAFAYSQSLATSYAILVTASFIAWLSLKSMNKDFVLNNPVSGNTIKSLGIASIVFIVFMILTIALSSQLGGLSQTIFSGSFGQQLHAFGTQSADALIGASADPILSQSRPIIATVFALFIPIMENYIYITLLIVLCVILGVKFTEGTFDVLKQPLFWVANVIMAVGAVYFHLNAKGIKDLPLLFVFIFFSLIGCLAVLKIGQKREMESANWLHILNNFTAVGSKIGLF